MTRVEVAWVETFWAKVRKTDGCWLWLAGTGDHGYGRVRVRGRTHRAHRIAYELLVGPIPVDLELDHLCRARLCVRPAQDEPVTHRENVMRGCGIGSQNAAKTVCDSGHSFDSANTYIRPNGHRDCRTCIRKRGRQYRARLVAV